MDVMTHMAPNMGVRSSGLIMLSLQACSRTQPVTPGPQFANGIAAGDLAITYSPDGSVMS